MSLVDNESQASYELIEKLFDRICREYALYGWSLEWVSTEPHKCHYSHKLVWLCKNLTGREMWYAKTWLLHEMAHAVVGGDDRHGAAWSDALAELTLRYMAP